MSYAPEFYCGQNPVWVSCSLRFETNQEALQWAQALQARWQVAIDIRAVSHADPANYRFIDGRLRCIIAGRGQ